MENPRVIEGGAGETERNEDAELGHVSASIGQVLFQALQQFQGQELATFRWRTPDKTHTTSVWLAEVGMPKQARSSTVRFKLAWGPERNQTTSADLMVFAAFARSPKPVISLHLDLFERRRSWQLAREEQLEAWKAPPSEDARLRSTYPFPRNSPGAERVGLVWYLPRKTDDLTLGISRESDALPCKPDLRAYWPIFDEEKERWSALLPPIHPDLPPKDWGACVLSFAIWSTLIHPFHAGADDGATDAISIESYGLPPRDSYWSNRPVNLDPHKVREVLEKQERLRLPWHVIEAACASLNAGKHILFTGPPGCGKSKLAIALARMVRQVEPIVATASPAWTSGDLIGRYLPRRDGKGLEFKPGHFLRAVDANRCLVLDEFNRADIDQCFGELFSVLAGDAVELPFEEELDEPLPAAESSTAAPSASGSDTASTSSTASPGQRIPLTGTVRIVPALHAHRRGRRPDDASEQYRDYIVSPEFRLIGTMNDADRSRLHQLSFALLRRFDILRVEAPPPDEVRNLIEQRIGVAKNQLAVYGYQFPGSKGKLPIEELCESYLLPLFAHGKETAKQGSAPAFTDLVAERVVGIATVEDVIRFVTEALRCPELDGNKKPYAVVLGEHQPIEVAASYLAMALARSVFPQLDALSIEQVQAAAKHIIDVFPEGSHPLVRIAPTPAKTGEPSKREYRVEKVPAGGSGMKDLNRDGTLSIAEYLVGELRLQFRDASNATWLGQLIPPPQAKDKPAAAGTKPA